MRFFHLSDLHIGKQLHGFSLIEDQIYILNQIIDQIYMRKPDAVLIAGDIYDKSAPSAEAVAVFDEFLTKLAKMENGPVVCVISGNHDSQERLAYGSRLFMDHKIYIAGNAPGREKPEIQKITMNDEHGDVVFYLLPFFRPSYLREIPGLESVKTYEETLEKLIEQEKPDFSVRNVLLCHQFFTNAGKEPERSDSESINVGGQDNIDGRIAAEFDYVAAGHIHRPQKIGKQIRYCGSPLKYSVSEAEWDKSVTEVTLGKKGECSLQLLPLKPLHDVRKIKGTLEELTSPLTLSMADPEDYVSVTLTDEEELYEPGQVLARLYPRMLEWKVENSRTRYELQEKQIQEEKKSLLELFGDFYEQMRGVPLNDQETSVMERIVRMVGGDRE